MTQLKPLRLTVNLARTIVIDACYIFCWFWDYLGWCDLELLGPPQRASEWRSSSRRHSQETSSSHYLSPRIKSGVNYNRNSLSFLFFFFGLKGFKAFDIGLFSFAISPVLKDIKSPYLRLSVSNSRNYTLFTMSWWLETWELQFPQYFAGFCLAYHLSWKSHKLDWKVKGSRKWWFCYYNNNMQFDGFKFCKKSCGNLLMVPRKSPDSRL